MPIAGDLAEGAFKWMKDGWEGFNACWERYKEVKDTYRRQEICEFYFGHFKGDAHSAKNLADGYSKDAKDKIREIQRGL